MWDLPTRLFHWGMAVFIPAAFITGENAPPKIHETVSLVVLGLLLFRLIWGFIGAPPARFSQLFYAPSAIWHYFIGVLKRDINEYEGHNPLGALAVLAMITLFLIMSITGLFMSDDILYSAPFAAFAPMLSSPMGRWHIALHMLVPLLILFHLLALIAHRLWLKEQVYRKMLAGASAYAAYNKRGGCLLVVCLIATQLLGLLSQNYY